MKKNEVQQVALFDFCETIVDFQTADAYVDYVRNEITGFYKTRMRILEWLFQFFLKTRLLAILNKLTCGELSISKRLKLLQLRNISYIKLDSLAKQYYKNCIKPHLIPVIMSQLERHQRDGLRIMIVSGGYDIYLKYFAKDFNIMTVLSTHIQFKNGRCVGIFNGKDCMNNNKVYLLKTLFCGSNYIFEFAYSDSRSDIPLLEFAKKGIVVSHINHQKWIDNYKFKEIIW